MSKIVGIRFKPAGKIYDFNSGAFVLSQGDCVIVETEGGLGMGTVAISPRSNGGQKATRKLKTVFRLASEADFKQKSENRKSEKKAHAFCLACIKELGLKMNLFGVESTFDARKLTFYFTADGRVDFRKLVKMLVRELGLRIEMRQVGIRNQSKMCGGIGRCGRELCCCSFLEKFGPVSIRMAKRQGLSLNPTKISGQCGRLMCCLTFEHNTYSSCVKSLPRIGTTVSIDGEKGKVIRQNVLRQLVSIRLASGNEIEVPSTKIKKTAK